MAVFHDKLAKILKTLRMGPWALAGTDASPSLTAARPRGHGRSLPGFQGPAVSPQKVVPGEGSVIGPHQACSKAPEA